MAGTRIVIKVGTSTLTGADGRVDRGYLELLAEQVDEVRSSGSEVVIVTSGAIAAGVEALGLTERPSDISDLQAIAAVGQARLVDAYAEALGRRDMTVGQVLLTRNDTAHRQQYLYACQTLDRLLEIGAVPVVNENDTVAVDEIRFGDNDTLAALVGIMVHADLVVLLTDIEGVYDGDPRSENGATLVSHVDEVTDELAAAAGGSGSAHGTGGMVTKLEAARALTKAGIPMVVCDGRRPGVVTAAAAGEPVGTYFSAGKSAVGSRKLWIAYGGAPSGTVVVDEGAKRALVERGKSLLPAGVVSVEGRFAAGEAVLIATKGGEPFARGLAEMSADELDRIKGLKTSEAAAAHPGLETVEVVHRDHLVIL
jgi:glutamate 5-kinase